VVVEANRSRSDLVNLKVAAGEDERATQGLSPIEHFVVGIRKGRDVRWACGQIPPVVPRATIGIRAYVRYGPSRGVPGSPSESHC
jgi:hypothetical protein